jgi:hypothetical protein
MFVCSVRQCYLVFKSLLLRPNLTIKDLFLFINIIDIEADCREGVYGTLASLNYIFLCIAASED